MKIILHIGQSKTGTTALQSFLSHNRKNLIAQGVMYPDYFIGGRASTTLNHNSFAEELCGLSRHPNFTIQKYWEQFLNQAKEHNCKVLLLSAESFFGAPQIWLIDKNKNFFDVYEEKITILSQLCSDLDTHIVCYLNKPEDWIETAIAHIIRYEGYFNKKIYKDDEQMYSLLKPHAQYDEILKLWLKHFKNAQYDVSPFEKEHLYNKDIISDFFQKIEINHTNFNKPHILNEHKSLDTKYVHVKKKLNKSIRSKLSERLIVECLDTLNSKLSKVDRYLLSPELKQIIIEEFEVSGKWLTENYANDQSSFFRLKNTHSNEDKNIEFDKELREFQILYNSFPMKVKRVEIFLKSYLRNNMPRFYTLIKKWF